MKAIGTVSAKNIFGMTAVAIFLMTGSSFAIEISPELASGSPSSDA